MNKAYLLVICLLLTPFTGCIEIEDSDLEETETTDEKEPEDLAEQCLGLEHSNVTFHFHSSLILTVRGEEILIPNNMGIGTSACPEGMHLLHTHTSYRYGPESVVPEEDQQPGAWLHIEAYESKTISLSLFFEVWNISEPDDSSLEPLFQDMDNVTITIDGVKQTLGMDEIIFEDGILIEVVFELIDQDYNMTVVEILDGDTFDLGNEERVRIIGINTPEKGRPFSDDATEALSEMIMGKEVTLVNDSKNDDADSSGRLLRHVYVNDSLVNYEMIRMGMAFWYPYSSGTDMDESYQEAQESAANDHVGLWTESQYNITIDYIEYDPEGSEVDGEYLIITNHDNYNINMEGWYLQDEAARTAYEFNYTLEINTSVRIYTGSGEDNQTALFWGWYQGIWNNSGDMAILQDEGGLMVDYYRYGYD